MRQPVTMWMQGGIVYIAVWFATIAPRIVVGYAAGTFAVARPSEERIVAAARSLSIFPARERPGEIDDTRELLVRRLPYTIVYTVIGETVYIPGVYDQRRDRHNRP